MLTWTQSPEVMKAEDGPGVDAVTSKFEAVFEANEAALKVTFNKNTKKVF